MILLLYLISVLTVYTFIRLFKFTLYQWRLYEQMKSLPGPKIGNPFAGNLSILQEIVAGRKDVAKKFYDKMIELSNRYGQQYGFFRLWLGPFTPWIVVCDAKLARRVLTSPKFTNKATYYRMMENFATGSSLFTLSALEARRERKILKEHFTLRYLQSYIFKTEVHLEALVKRLNVVVEKEAGYYSDINHLVSSFIYDTVGDNLFSAHFTSITTGEEPPYLSAIHEMILWLEIAILQPWRYITSNKILIFFLNLFNHMSISYSRHAVKPLIRYQKAVWDIVRARYDQLKTTKSKGKSEVNWSIVDTEKPSLIDSLLLNRVLLKKNQGNILTRSWNLLSSFVDVMWHADMFIVAGHDTTTASISWTLYNLAHSIQSQKRAREEVLEYLENLKSTGEVPNQRNLKQLSYLECCIKEALRLHPVAPFLGRFGQAELPISKEEEISIPSFVDVTVFYDYAHRQERYFPEANEYRPERYLDKVNRPTFDLDQQTDWVDPNRASFPFSLGERGCLGQQYAMSQMKLLFVRLLSNFEIHSLPEENVVDEHHFLTKPPRFPVKIVKLKNI